MRKIKINVLHTALLALYVVSASFGLRAGDRFDEQSRQVWFNYILGKPISEKWYVEYDFEGAKQVSGGEPWYSLNGTALAEYYPNAYLDLTAELATGITRQNREENTFEAAAALGVRLHIVKQIFLDPLIASLGPERFSGKRYNIAALLRLQRRQFWYSRNIPNTGDTRFRYRLESNFALNKASLATDGVWNLLADIEWFWPLYDEIPERFATKRRIRLGLGYRHSYHWRYDIVLMSDKVRDTLDGDAKVDARTVDFRVKMIF
jgi:hypothetical protein